MLLIMNRINIDLSFFGGCMGNKAGITIVAGSGGKGGTGKSATLCNLAGVIANRGLSVCIADADTGNSSLGTNGTRAASNFGAQRQLMIEKGAEIPHIEVYAVSNEESIAEKIKAWRKVYDYVLIDPPGGVTKCLKTAIGLSDHILLPNMMNADEYVSLQEILNLISSIEEAAEAAGYPMQLDTRILPCRVPSNWRLDTDTFAGWYNAKRRSIAGLSGVKIPFSSNLAKTVSYGRTVSDKLKMQQWASPTKERAHFELLLAELAGERQPLVARTTS